MASLVSPATARRWLAHPSVWWTGFAAWWITLFILSSNALPETEGVEFPNIDKLAHFVYFALGAACLTLAVRCMPARRLSAGVLFLVVVLTISGIGALDEWYQTFNPARTGGDLGDWIADTVGAVAGAAAALIVVRRSATVRNVTQASQPVPSSNKHSP